MNQSVSVEFLFLIGVGSAMAQAQPCPIVDRGSPVDGITSITVISGAAPCVGDPLFAGWQCMRVLSDANDNGVTYGLDIRWNHVGQTPRGSFTWMIGGASTGSMRETAEAAQQVQDALETVDQVRTIELRYLGELGSKTPPRNGFVNISAVYADVLEFLVAVSIAEGVIGHYGNSAGSMQGANALAYHELEQVLDGVVFGGGPFWSNLEQVCAIPSSPLFAPPFVRERVDQWNWLDLNGGSFCGDVASQSVPSYECRSTLGIEADAEYPNLIVSVIVGTLDEFNPWMDPSATDYWNNITVLSKTFDRPVAPHLVVSSPEGANTVHQRIVDIVNARAPATGDANCDGTLNLDDVQALVLALIRPGLYQSIFSGCAGADVNGDGLADGGDISAFVRVLVGT